MRNQNPRQPLLDILEKNPPKMRYKSGEDFYKWQKRARQKLRELLCLDEMQACDFDYLEEERKETEKYTQIRFSFQSEEGYYVPGYLRFPKNASGKFKPMICLQGHSKGMHIALGEPKYEGDYKSIAAGGRDLANIAVDNGFCAVVMEQRYMGECGGTPEGPGCARGGKGVTATPSLMFGRCAIGERVWDIIRLIDLLEEKFPEIDSEFVYCMGNSGGGTATFYAACMDERIKCAFPACSVCGFKESIIEIHHCACNYIPNIAKYFDMGDMGGLIAPRNLFVFSGLKDPIFPKHGVDKAFSMIKSLYAAAGAEGKAVHIAEDCEHRFFAQHAYDAMKEYMK